MQFEEFPRRPKESPYWDAALPLMILAAAGALVVLAGQVWNFDSWGRAEYFLRNFLGASGRTKMIVSLGLGALVGTGVAAAVLFTAPAAIAVRRLENLAHCVCPLLLTPFVPALFNHRFSHENQLLYVATLGVFSIGSERLFRVAFAAFARTSWPKTADLANRLRRLPLEHGTTVLVVCASLLFASFVTHYTIQTHQRLGTAAFDLGIYDNLMFNALSGRPFQSPVLYGPGGGNYLAGHAELAMLLFVPLYGLRPGPEFMLALQGTLLGLAAIPLFFVAARFVGRGAAVLIAFGFLLFAPLHGPLFYDFHWLPLAVFFHFCLYAALVARRLWLAAVLVLVLCMFREDVPVGLACLGLFLLVTRQMPRFGAGLAVFSAAWFVMMRFVIMPRAGAFSGFQGFYLPLMSDGDVSFRSVVRTIVSNPVYLFSTLLQDVKALYILHLLAPLAFLPCRHPALLLLLIPGSFFTLLTGGYPPTLSISFQYTTHWIPYLFLATILGLWMMRNLPDAQIRRRAALASLVMCLGAHSYNFGAVFNRENFIGGFQKIEFQMTDTEKEAYANLRSLVELIPREASVTATDLETPHISTRQVAFALHWPPGPVDYILVNRRHLNDLVMSSLRAGLADPAYGLFASRGDDFFLFKRGHAAPEETKRAKRSLGLPE